MKDIYNRKGDWEDNYPIAGPTNADRSSDVLNFTRRIGEMIITQCTTLCKIEKVAMFGLPL